MSKREERYPAWVCACVVAGFCVLSWAFIMVAILAVRAAIGD